MVDAKDSQRVEARALGPLAWLEIPPWSGITAETLPLELWVEILSYLSYADVLRFRQACKWMSRITTARPIWLCQYRRLCASVSNPPGHGQHSIYATANDLEKATLRRLKWEALWRSSTPSLTLTKDVDVPMKRSRSVVVVDGRWLLFIRLNPEGLGEGVFVYDMYNPLPKPKKLVKPFLALSNVHEVAVVSVDVDASQPSLVFNLCVTVALKKKDDDTWPCYGLVFYRVTQSGFGLDARLKSKCFKSLVLSARGRYPLPLRVQLRGRHYLRLFEQHAYNRATTLRLEVYDWHASDLQTHIMSFIGMKTLYPPTFCKLLPNDHLLACWDNTIHLFHLIGFQTVRSGETLPLENEMISSWSDALPPGRFMLSTSKPAFHHPSSSVRVAYSMSTGIFGVSVPLPGCGPPLHIKLSDTILPYDAALTTEKFIYFQGMHRIVKGCFAWPHDVPWGDDKQVVETRFLALSCGRSILRFFKFAFDDQSCSVTVRKGCDILTILHV